MYFNGTSDYVQLQQSTPTLKLPLFTVCAKFKTSKDYTKQQIDGMIVNKGGTGGEESGGNQNYGIRVFKSTNKIRAGFETSGGTDYEPASTVTVNDGQWHFVLCSYDKQQVKLYLDGTLNSTMNTTANPELNSKPFVIGRNSKDNTRWFQGDIIDVRVWNRPLTDAEALQVYQGIIPTAGLVYPL